MAGFRSKLIFLLIVYFAGFATAIYCLVPVPENADGKTCEKGFAHSVLKSDDFAKSFNSGMHKCIAFGRETACKAGKFIKGKYDSTQQTDG